MSDEALEKWVTQKAWEFHKGLDGYPAHYDAWVKGSKVGWREATRQAEARSQVQIVLLGDALRSYRTYHDAGQAKGDYDYPVCKCQQCQKAEKALTALRKEES